MAAVDEMVENVKATRLPVRHQAIASLSMTMDVGARSMMKRLLNSNSQHMQHFIMANNNDGSDSRPLSLQEQSLLTETVNDLPKDHLYGVIEIIQDAVGLGGEEDKIDLRHFEERKNRMRTNTYC